MRTDSATDRKTDEEKSRTFRMGVRLFVASLGTLIGASLVAYAVVRLSAPTWPPDGVPGPPAGLWVSTVLILLASVSVERALRAIRRNAQSALKLGLLLTFALLVGFLVSQVMNGLVLMDRVGDLAKKNLFAFTFFMLTALHALHLLGGFLPLALTTKRAFEDRYDREHHDGVWAVAFYLHFLDAAWLAMFLLIIA